MHQIDQRREDDEDGVTMTAKRRLPDLLVTLVARPAVPNISGTGTAAPMRGMFAWHLTIMLP